MCSNYVPRVKNNLMSLEWQSIATRQQDAFQIDYVCQTHLAKEFTHPVIFRIADYKRSAQGETSHILRHLSAWFTWGYADTETTKWINNVPFVKVVAALTPPFFNNNNKQKFKQMHSEMSWSGDPKLIWKGVCHNGLYAKIYWGIKNGKIEKIIQSKYCVNM